MISPIKTLQISALTGLCGLALATANTAIAADFSVNLAPEDKPSVLLAQAGTVVDVAAGEADFSTLVAAIEAAGLVEALSSDGPFTVFAPTNEAFEALDSTLMTEYGISVADLLLPANLEILQAVLTYHVIGADVMAADIPQGVTTVPALDENELQITRVGDEVSVNMANVTATDIEATNGVIHVIDAVLIPPQVAAALEASVEETPEVAPSTETTTPTETAPAEPVRGLW